MRVLLFVVLKYAFKLLGLALNFLLERLAIGSFVEVFESTQMVILNEVKWEIAFSQLH